MIDVSNFAVITFDVPAERVLRHLPPAYQLDTFEGREGLRAFVSTTCFCNGGFRPTGLSFPRHSFSESTYRTYVSRNADKGVYFFGRYLGTRLAWSLQRPIARHTYEADFELSIESNVTGYLHYECTASSSWGQTYFALEANDLPKPQEPFRSGEEMVQFLTYRPDGYFTAGSGGQGHMPVDHPPMRAFAGSLRSARFDLWMQLGVLTPEDVATPHSVLVVPQVPLRLFPPRPTQHQRARTRNNRGLRGRPSTSG